LLLEGSYALALVTYVIKGQRSESPVCANHSFLRALEEAKHEDE